MKNNNGFINSIGLLVPYNYTNIHSNFNILNIIVEAVVFNDPNILTSGLIDLLDDHPDRENVFKVMQPEVLKQYHIVRELLTSVYGKIEELHAYMLSEVVPCESNNSTYLRFELYDTYYGSNKHFNDIIKGEYK